MLKVGDDCALFPVPAGLQVATSTDLLIEGRHFFPAVDPQALGHKALAVNLSDLAAMGAQPLGCLLGLALPRADLNWLAAFAQGFQTLAARLCCPLLGGDTTRSVQGITISVTVFGTVAPSRALRRDGAQVGDDVWVSGALGEADIAYRLLAGQMLPNPQLLAATRLALERPVPRLSLGLALTGVAHAAIDISDGLLQDLGHILRASGVGARLRYDALPVAAPLVGLPLDCVRQAVLGGGEAYELCFTAATTDRQKVQAAAAAAGVAVTHIGQVEATSTTIVVGPNDEPLTDLPHGFDHFL